MESNVFNCATVNTRSLVSPNRMEEFLLALSTRNFDVVGVSETRLKGSFAQDFMTSNYKFFAHGSDASQHSGTGFFVKFFTFRGETM